MQNRLGLLSALYFLAGSMHPLYAAAPLTLAREGASDYALVVATEASEAETYAAEELTNFVHRATGALLPVVDETAHAGGPAIYLGRTAFAAGQGIDVDSLGQEEWLLRAVGNDLILTGGRPRGTLYGVYAFLETQLGVRFLDPYTEHVPRTPTLAVAADLEVRDAPGFDRREIYTVVSGTGPAPWTVFQVRRRINSFANAWRMIPGKYGYSIKYGSPYTAHTHFRYVADFPEAFDQPEHFALTTRGNRHHNQPCMSHPDVRRIFAECLREYIRRDREALLAEGQEPGAFPRYYSLSPNDGSDGKCVCERCLALKEKHGSYAAVVLDFANAIGEALAGDFPDIRLRQGAAYLYYRDVPTGIQPRDNVFLSVAQWPALHPRRDHIRSVFHPLNDAPRKEFEAWAQIGVQGMHDYWKWGVSGPQVFVRELAETLEFYHQHGVRHFLTENLLRGSRLHNFVDLQFYMASRLLLDPAQAVEPMIDEFMALYYGPAAPHMEALLAYLEARKDLDESYLWAIPLSARAAFDPAFFIETDAMLRKAEAAVAEDPAVLANVRQERLAIDEAMLNLWHGLVTEAGVAWPFDRAEVLERLERNYDHGWEKYNRGRPHATHAWERPITPHYRIRTFTTCMCRSNSKVQPTCRGRNARMPFRSTA